MREPVGEIRRIVDRILAVPGRFTPESVSDTCSVMLFEVACGNPYMREFEVHPETGPFPTSTFRGSAVSSAHLTNLVSAEASARCRIAQAHPAGRFHLFAEYVGVNPRIPPEGVVSFQETHGLGTLHSQFNARCRTFRAVSVHETP